MQQILKPKRFKNKLTRFTPNKDFNLRFYIVVVGHLLQLINNLGYGINKREILLSLLTQQRLQVTCTPYVISSLAIISLRKRELAALCYPFNNTTLKTSGQIV